MTDPASLTDEELAEMLTWQHHHLTPTEARLIAALRASRAEVERLREALHFYANPEHWEPVLIQAATPGGPNEWASEWTSPEAMDGGDIARRALNVHLP